MTKSFRTLLTAGVLCSTMLFTAGLADAQDAQTCQPGYTAAINGPRRPRYLALGNVLLGATTPNAKTIAIALNALHDDATYATLLADSQAVAARLATGRIVVTLPDGTVVVDTSKNNNSYANYLAKAINENHNSRVAIFSAQQFACGVGVETKLSTTDGTVESYFATRIGKQLDSLGTVRMSTKQ